MFKMKSKKLKYQTILEEFLKARGWEDELEIKKPEGDSVHIVSLDTSVNQDGTPGRLIIECYEPPADVVYFHFYLDIKCKPAKFDQMTILLNEINIRGEIGHFEVFRDGGHIRWKNKVDFEGSQPTGVSITQNCGPGMDSVGKYGEVITAVALTKQSAADALKEYDEEQEAKEKADSSSEGGAPTEL
jgi:hypothetical protein